ncbi:MAG: Zn-ribbon domain-containing OB-fold protein [Dehalococcoidia bacterium]|nr:Zn-ribbon domain-containing OB-fold protein [Dehalococcoidia bacterium]
MGIRSEELGNTGTLMYPSRIKLPYIWHAGKAGSRFYRELKENRAIWGTRCSPCNRVFLPPREVCPRCLDENLDWVRLSDSGTLLTYTVVRYHVPGIQPQEPPYALGIIKLDGATSGFPHLLGEIEPERLKAGIRVQAVFREDRRGDYLDIQYFRPEKP